jgi:arylsulfatase A
VDETTMTMDLYPTFAQLSGADLTIEKTIDGISLNSLLFRNEKLPDRTLFWKMGNEIAVRNGSWKLVKIGDQPNELYNLDQDLGEENDLVESHPEISLNLWSGYLDWEKQVRKSAVKWK